MIDAIALKAVLNATHRTLQVALIIIFSHEHVFAVRGGAFADIRILVSELFPFESVAPGSLLLGQQLSEIGDRHNFTATGLGADDWQLRIFDARLEPLVKTLFMVDA